jgi:hypothetical protein
MGYMGQKSKVTTFFFGPRFDIPIVIENPIFFFSPKLPNMRSFLGVQAGGPPHPQFGACALMRCEVSVRRLRVSAASAASAAGHRLEVEAWNEHR